MCFVNLTLRKKTMSLTKLDCDFHEDSQIDKMIHKAVIRLAQSLLAPYDVTVKVLKADLSVFVIYRDNVVFISKTTELGEFGDFIKICTILASLLSIPK